MYRPIRARKRLLNFAHISTLVVKSPPNVGNVHCGLRIAAGEKFKGEKLMLFSERRVIVDLMCALISYGNLFASVLCCV